MSRVAPDDVSVQPKPRARPARGQTGVMRVSQVIGDAGEEFQQSGEDFFAYFGRGALPLVGQPHHEPDILALGAGLRVVVHLVIELDL